MSEMQEKKAAQTAVPPLAERDVPLDTRLLSEAVIELNISRKNVGIYPPGHSQIARSIDRAFDLLQRLFEITTEMTLGVAKDTLLVGQDYLDPKNPVFRDFALSLNQQGIAAVTFSSGLDKEELTRFHRILATKAEDLRAAGGIEQVMSGASLPHIRIAAIDYSLFHATEEKEVARPQSTKKDTSVADVWQDFVFHLSAGTLASPGEGTSINESEEIDPAELARLLNESKLDASAAVESYDRIISSYVRDSAERKLTQEQSKTLSRMNALLRDLNPELRKQFLAAAFNRVSTRAANPRETEVLGGFADDLVVEMLEQASAEGREISPTLAGLVGRLAGTQGGASAGEQQGGGQPQGFIAPIIMPENMQKLFEREKYEEYVSGEYKTMLRQLSEETPGAAEAFPLEGHLATLEDDRIDMQIGRALLAFLEENIDEEDYRELAQKLVAVMPQFLDSGNFELLWDIFETLRRHETDKQVQGVRDIAKETRTYFTSPEFIARALKAFERWMREKGQEAAGLIQALGPDAVPGLLDIYAKEEAVGGSRVLFNLLCLFGEPAVREAQKRLKDPRAYYVRNLLILIRRAGAATSVSPVRPLLQHKDQAVRLEALGTLLKFKDPSAVEPLRDAIHAADPDFAAQAIVLAGQYRVADVTDDVLSKLKRVILFETDYAENEEIIRALGNIGDPRAISDLEKLARAALSFYPRSLMHMKETIYESLARYPRQSIARLVKIGEGLNSDSIQRICRQLTDKQ